VRVLQQLERIAARVVVANAILGTPAVLDPIELLRSDVEVLRAPEVRKMTPGRVEGLLEGLCERGLATGRRHNLNGDAIAGEASSSSEDSLRYAEADTSDQSYTVDQWNAPRAAQSRRS